MKKYLLATLSLLALGQVQALENSTIDLEFCHIPGMSEEVLCGTYTVEENRQQPNGRTIDIHVSIIPSVSEAKEPDPLVLFAGGPGQGARAMGRFIRMSFSGVNENRDVVLIDQRGMGDSAPLACDFPENQITDMDPAAMKEMLDGILKECAANLDADATQYTQDIANQDIHEILQALGYDQVNLYGASWGTRSILLYANQFPDQIRTVTVDGVAPLTNKVPLYFTRDAEKAMNLLLQDCKMDDGCGAAFEDLEQRFRQFMNDFPEAGIKTTIPDPNTGKLTEATILKQSVISSIRTMLYSPDMSRMLPLVMERVIEQDFRPLVGIMSASSDFGMTIGATLTILCSEEFARFSEADMNDQASNGFESGTFAEFMHDSCKLWPKAPLPEIYTQELVQNMPTLILNGTLDPVTPPYWGDDMQVHFPNSRHLIAPNTGHNVAPVGCADDLIAQFIKEASYENLDDSCLDEIKRPSFFLNASGPVARTEQ